MNATILHESRGRIRFRLRQKQMTLAQADLLEAWIQGKSWCRQVTVHERTCCVILYYDGTRQAVLNEIRHFSWQEAEQTTALPAHSSRALNREFEEKLVAKVVCKAACTLFLPPPLRLARILWHMVPFVRRGMGCLLRRRVDKTMADAVRDWCRANGVDGIQIRQDTRRVYPQGNFMGGILGFTDVDNAGLWGLELRYNDELTGQNGRILTAKNAWGYDMPTHYQTLVDAVPGSTLTLTIDANIQHWLESALSAAVTEHHVAERGVGIVMDVHTGAVLAMSCQPDYDPNAPRTLINKEVRDAVNALTGEERSAALQKAQQAQWRNKAISDLYEPGSVFKLITASAALDSGACKATDYFTCAGKITVAGTRFRCANGHIHGTETFARGLAVSCNPCFIQIGARLGKERFCDYFAAFGLREATGIDLPGEVRRSEYYTADRMGPVELASCSFGQSSKVSYLQILTAVCAVVNGGELMQPYVVAKITAPDGTVVKEVQPTVKRRVISAETSATMCRLMEGVVTGGTGKQAALAGYRIGGKSGTSQKLDSANEGARIASFVSVAPIDDPKVAVLVCLDEPHSWTTSGGALSGPVCAEVLGKVLPYLGVERENGE